MHWIPLHVGTNCIHASYRGGVTEISHTVITKGAEMSDAEIVASIRGGIISHSHLKRLVTLAENYMVLRDETSHLEFTARGVHYYTGEGHSLDAVLEIARKGGER